MGRILIFFLFFPLAAQAQERISLIADRDIYFAGDMIWLSAFYSAESEFSRILLVELVDGKAVYAKGKIPIQNGRASGTLRIPEGIPAKNYQLRAYTNWQRNFPPEYYCTLELTILNPATPLPNPLSSYQVFSGNKKEKPVPGFAIQGLKDRYAPRETVTFSLSCPVETDAAVSIVKKGTMRNLRPVHFENIPEKQLVGSLSPGLLPDIRDVSLSGVLIDSASGLPAKGEWVYATVVGQGSQQLHVYKTDENGAFIFPLNHLTGLQRVAVSANLNRQILIHSDFSDRYAEFPSVAYTPDSTLRQLFEEMYVNSQLERKYITVQTDSAGLPGAVSNWFGRPAASIVLSDFIALPTMEDVFTEIVTYVSVKRKNRQYQLWVLDREETGFDTDPLVLIDNVPVFDPEALMQINPALVERIDVINEPYMLGSHSISSLISITTRTPDFAGMKFPGSTVFLNYQTRETPLAFPQVASDLPARLPDFRTVLYWDPMLSLGPRAREISFRTSDHESEYSVWVRGYDAEGNYFSWEEGFEVSKK